MGSGKVIYEEGLPNMLGNAQIFPPYMRRSLVTYDFAPDPSEFPNTYMRKILSSFYQCTACPGRPDRLRTSCNSSWGYISDRHH